MPVTPYTTFVQYFLAHSTLLVFLIDSNHHYGNSCVAVNGNKVVVDCAWTFVDFSFALMFLACFSKCITADGEETWVYDHKYWEYRKSPGFVNMQFEALW
jgi:hypothetical protein